MIKSVYPIHNKNEKQMNNSMLADIVNLGSLAASLVGVSVWGGSVNSRLKSVEKKADEIDSRQNRIEKKLDMMQLETNKRIDDCKETLIDVILGNKKYK